MDKYDYVLWFCWIFGVVSTILINSIGYYKFLAYLPWLAVLIANSTE